jgi:hypothetical protein
VNRRQQAAGHDTATLKAFQVRLAKSAAIGADLPIDSPSRILAVSLRLNAKRGIVTGPDADDRVRIRD